jgi:hypothetical protein
MSRIHSVFQSQTGKVSRGAIIAELDPTYMEDARLCLAMCDTGGPIDAPACTPGGPTVVTLISPRWQAYEEPLVRTCTVGVPREAA